jgi:hypothetical protein
VRRPIPSGESGGQPLSWWVRMMSERDTARSGMRRRDLHASRAMFRFLHSASRPDVSGNFLKSENSTWFEASGTSCLARRSANLTLHRQLTVLLTAR